MTQVSKAWHNKHRVQLHDVIQTTWQFQDFAKDWLERTPHARGYYLVCDTEKALRDLGTTYFADYLRFDLYNLRFKRTVVWKDADTIDPVRTMQTQLELRFDLAPAKEFTFYGGQMIACGVDEAVDPADPYSHISLINTYDLNDNVLKLCKILRPAERCVPNTGIRSWERDPKVFKNRIHRDEHSGNLAFLETHTVADGGPPFTIELEWLVTGGVFKARGLLLYDHCSLDLPERKGGYVSRSREFTQMSQWVEEVAMLSACGQTIPDRRFIVEYQSFAFFPNPLRRDL